MQLTATIVVVSLFTVTVLLVVLTSIAAHTLKRRFPSVWVAEGEPEAWLWLQRTGPSGSVLAFLDERRYLAANNRGYSRFCTVLRLGWYLFFLLFIVGMISVGLAVFSKQNAA